MDILLGTTNPSKIKWFSDLVGDDSLHFLTLRDLGIDKIPDEDGATPAENAIRKATWYGRFCDHVITNDSGLYFRGLPMDDPRQPGLFIRRSTDGRELTDEEMIAHYSALIDSLGGEVMAGYASGYCVYNNGKIYTYMDDEETQALFAFRMVSAPHPSRSPGWPLDSLSINIYTGNYFVEERTWSEKAEDPAVTEKKHLANERLRQFLRESLGIL